MRKAYFVDYIEWISTPRVRVGTIAHERWPGVLRPSRLSREIVGAEAVRVTIMRPHSLIKPVHLLRWVTVVHVATNVRSVQRVRPILNPVKNSVQIPR